MLKKLNLWRIIVNGRQIFDQNIRRDRRVGASLFSCLIGLVSTGVGFGSPWLVIGPCRHIAAALERWDFLRFWPFLQAARELVCGPLHWEHWCLNLHKSPCLHAPGPPRRKNQQKPLAKNSVFWTRGDLPPSYRKGGFLANIALLVCSRKSGQ